MPARTRTNTDASLAAQPLVHQRGREVQPYGTLRDLPGGLPVEARARSVEVLNGILADSLHLFLLYKKHHWQVMGHTFYQLHLLFDKHAEEQLALIDLIAERIQALGGVTVATPHDVSELTRLERAPRGSEPVPVQISRLLEAHESIIRAVRQGIETTEQVGDWGTNDLLMSDVLRAHEKQVWFLAQHLVDTPAVRVDGDTAAER